MAGHATRRSENESKVEMKCKAKGSTMVKKRKQRESTKRSTADQVEDAYLSRSNRLRRTPSEKRSNFSKEEHREFVSAVFDIGLKESSPLSVMNHMSKRSKDVYEGLNLERIKSKLQKYRKKKKISKDEFMLLYDDTLANFCSMLHEGENENGVTRFLPTVESLSSSEIAAYLTYCIMNEKLLLGTHKNKIVSPIIEDLTPVKSNKREQTGKTNNQNNYSQDNKLTVCAESSNNNINSKLSIPVLTEAERNSPIGKAFVYFMELFKTVEMELYIGRSNCESEQATEQKKVPHQNQGPAKNHTQASHPEETQKPQQPQQSMSIPLNSTVFRSSDSSLDTQQNSIGDTFVPSLNSFSSLQSHSFNSSTQQTNEESTERAQPITTPHNFPNNHNNHNHNTSYPPTTVLSRRNYGEEAMVQKPTTRQYFPQHQQLYENDEYENTAFEEGNRARYQN